jgi:hypothetical protein
VDPIPRFGKNQWSGFAFRTWFANHSLALAPSIVDHGTVDAAALQSALATRLNRTASTKTELSAFEDASQALLRAWKNIKTAQKSQLQTAVDAGIRPSLSSAESLLLQLSGFGHLVPSSAASVGRSALNSDGTFDEHVSPAEAAELLSMLRAAPMKLSDVLRQLHPDERSAMAAAGLLHVPGTAVTNLLPKLRNFGSHEDAATEAGAKHKPVPGDIVSALSEQWPLVVPVFPPSHTRDINTRRQLSNTRKKMDYARSDDAGDLGSARRGIGARRESNRRAAEQEAQAEEAFQQDLKASGANSWRWNKRSDLSAVAHDHASPSLRISPINAHILIAPLTGPVRVRLWERTEESLLRPDPLTGTFSAEFDPFFLEPQVALADRGRTEAKAYLDALNAVLSGLLPSNWDLSGPTLDESTLGTNSNGTHTEAAMLLLASQKARAAALSLSTRRQASLRTLAAAVQSGKLRSNLTPFQAARCVLQGDPDLRFPSGNSQLDDAHVRVTEVRVSALQSSARITLLDGDVHAEQDDNSHVASGPSPTKEPAEDLTQSSAIEATQAHFRSLLQQLQNSLSVDPKNVELSQSLTELEKAANALAAATGMGSTAAASDAHVTMKAFARNHKSLALGSRAGAKSAHVHLLAQVTLDETQGGAAEASAVLMDPEMTPIARTMASLALSCHFFADDAHMVNITVPGSADGDLAAASVPNGRERRARTLHELKHAEKEDELRRRKHRITRWHEEAACPFLGDAYAPPFFLLADYKEAIVQPGESIFIPSGSAYSYALVDEASKIGLAVELAVADISNIHAVVSALSSLPFAVPDSSKFLSDTLVSSAKKLQAILARSSAQDLVFPDIVTTLSFLQPSWAPTRISMPFADALVPHFVPSVVNAVSYLEAAGSTSFAGDAFADVIALDDLLADSKPSARRRGQESGPTPTKLTSAQWAAIAARLHALGVLPIRPDVFSAVLKPFSLPPPSEEPLLVDVLSRYIDLTWISPSIAAPASTASANGQTDIADVPLSVALPALSPVGYIVHWHAKPANGAIARLLKETGADELARPRVLKRLRSPPVQLFVPVLSHAGRGNISEAESRKLRGGLDATTIISDFRRKALEENNPSLPSAAPPAKGFDSFYAVQLEDRGIVDDVSGTRRRLNPLFSSPHAAPFLQASGSLGLAFNEPFDADPGSDAILEDHLQDPDDLDQQAALLRILEDEHKVPESERHSRRLTAEANRLRGVAAQPGFRRFDLKTFLKGVGIVSQKEHAIKQEDEDEDADMCEENEDCGEVFASSPLNGTSARNTSAERMKPTPVPRGMIATDADDGGIHVWTEGKSMFITRTSADGVPLDLSKLVTSESSTAEVAELIVEMARARSKEMGDAALSEPERIIWRALQEDQAREGELEDDANDTVKQQRELRTLLVIPTERQILDVTLDRDMLEIARRLRLAADGHIPSVLAANKLSSSASTTSDTRTVAKRDALRRSRELLRKLALVLPADALAALDVSLINRAPKSNSTSEKLNPADRWEALQADLSRFVQLTRAPRDPLRDSADVLLDLDEDTDGAALWAAMGAAQGGRSMDAEKKAARMSTIFASGDDGDGHAGHGSMFVPSVANAYSLLAQNTAPKPGATAGHAAQFASLLAADGSESSVFACGDKKPIGGAICAHVGPLLPSHIYTFRVASVTQEGITSTFSENSLPVPIPAVSVPSKIRGKPIAIAKGIDTVQISWHGHVPVKDGGVPILGYLIMREDLGHASSADAAAYTSRNSARVLFSKPGEWSHPIVVPRFVSTIATSLALPPTDPLRKTLEKKEFQASAAESTVQFTDGSADHRLRAKLFGLLHEPETATIIALEPGAQYRFVVAAINAAGVGPFSAPTDVITTERETDAMSVNAQGVYRTIGRIGPRGRMLDLPSNPNRLAALESDFVFEDASVLYESILDDDVAKNARRTLSADKESSRKERAEARDTIARLEEVRLNATLRRLPSPLTEMDVTRLRDDQALWGWTGSSGFDARRDLSRLSEIDQAATLMTLHSAVSVAFMHLRRTIQPLEIRGGRRLPVRVSHLLERSGFGLGTFNVPLKMLGGSDVVTSLIDGHKLLPMEGVSSGAGVARAVALFFGLDVEAKGTFDTTAVDSSAQTLSPGLDARMHGHIFLPGANGLEHHSAVRDRLIDQQKLERRRLHKIAVGLKKEVDMLTQAAAELEEAVASGDATADDVAEARQLANDAEQKLYGAAATAAHGSIGDMWLVDSAYAAVATGNVVPYILRLGKLLQGHGVIPRAADTGALARQFVGGINRRLTSAEDVKAAAAQQKAQERASLAVFLDMQNEVLSYRMPLTGETVTIQGWRSAWSPRALTLTAPSVASAPLDGVCAGRHCYIANEDEFAGKIVVFERGKIPLVKKVQMAAAEGAKGVIIIDDEHDRCRRHTFTQACVAGSDHKEGGFSIRDSPALWSEAKIPALLIGRAEGLELLVRMKHARA